ncbi:hypothetical protein [Methanoregula sp.]|uniref:hypothetical protein n=1 Tax=Methanoregula sp. TaxID=2052170 RepID=UPI003C7710B8
MNDRGELPHREPGGDCTDSCVPLVPHPQDSLPGKNHNGPAPARKTGIRAAAKREPCLVREALFTVSRDHVLHIVSEQYFYKTEPYYTILRHEMEGKTVLPSSSAVLDASVVPICLERAHMEGIPVCEWGISQGYVPLPSILYGLNYFANTSDYSVVRDNETAKEIVKHITNKGKYPFCYQELKDGATIESCVSIFGNTTGTCDSTAEIARKIYGIFAIPLVTLVLVRYGDRCLLSSLAPTKYSQLTPAERALLAAYLQHQEFL